MTKENYLYEERACSMLKAMGYSERACKTCTYFNTDEGEDGEDEIGLCGKNCVLLEVKADGTGHCDHHGLGNTKKTNWKQKNEKRPI